MGAGFHRMLATRCLFLCSAGFSFWLQKNSYFPCSDFFFFLLNWLLSPWKNIDFCLFLLLCEAKPACGSYQPLRQCQQASGNSIPQVLTFLWTSRKATEGPLKFVAFRTHTARQNHSLFIYFLSYSSDWSCWKIKTQSQFKPTHTVPLTAPICFKGLFPPLISAVLMYKQKMIENNWVTLSAWGYSWPSWCSWSRQELCSATLVGVAEIWHSGVTLTDVTNYLR